MFLVQGKYLVIGSSSLNSPLSLKSKIAVAVKLLVMEAMRKTLFTSGTFLVFRVISPTPNTFISFPSLISPKAIPGIFLSV